MTTTATNSDILRLQESLLHLMAEVQQRGHEDPLLRAEVLLTMNLLCGPELLVGCWQLLEATSARQEVMLMRLLLDLSPADVLRACQTLVDGEDEELRSVGYAMLALQGSPESTAILLPGLQDEPAVVVGRAGRRHLAPYSFVTCLLAGLHEFRDPVIDKTILQCLKRHAQKQPELALIQGLLREQPALVTKLAVVTLGSRVMGILHRAAYECVVCGQTTTLLDEPTRHWLRAALQMAPEVIEVICDLGPAGLDGPAFVRARIQALGELGADLLTHLCAKLLQAKLPLPSLSVEAALHPKSFVDTPSTLRRRSRTLAFLLALMLDYRPALAELVDGLAQGHDLEAAAVERLLLISGTQGPLNFSLALISHWYQLDPNKPDERPFWRWIDGLWHDDRHLQLSEQLDMSLRRPDETAMFACTIVESVEDERGRTLRLIRGGQLIERHEMATLVNASLALAVLQTQLRDPDLVLHPKTLTNIARVGISSLVPMLRARRRTLPDDHSERNALEYSLTLLEARRLAVAEPDAERLLSYGFKALDLRLEGCTQALDRFSQLSRNHPLIKALEGYPTRHVVQLFLWPPSHLHEALEAHLKDPVLCAEMVIDLGAARCCLVQWRDFNDALRAAIPVISPAPSPLNHQLLEIPWGLLQSELPDHLVRIGGELVAMVPRDGETAWVRAWIQVASHTLRLEFDRQGRLFRILRDATPPISLTQATQQMQEIYGAPTFRSPSSATWCFDTLTVHLGSDPGFDGVVEMTTVKLV